MAQRLGAGGHFRSSTDRLDDDGLLMAPPPSGMGSGKPLIYFNDSSFEYESDETRRYSPQQQIWGLGQHHERERGTWERDWSPSASPERQFFIIREGTPASASPSTGEAQRQPNHHHHQQRYQPVHPPLGENGPSPQPLACFMARTDSGRGFLAAANQQPAPCGEFSPEEDSEAAFKVEQHIKRAKGKVKRHERILRTLIHPKAHADKRTDFPLDNAALESIFSAADEIFFYGKLSRRVHWEWSSGCVSVPQQGGGGGASRIIGTTALRTANYPHTDGYETLIVLSSPILKDTSYNRRLLISTFLHELIHSYLFICCGFKARHCGGHTPGFQHIAKLIDQWVGHDTLRLCDIDADLERFKEPQRNPTAGRHHHHHGGVDFYDLTGSAAPWSAGPEVVFGAEERGADRSWHESDAGLVSSGSISMPTSSSPFSSATALVEHDRWMDY